MKLKKFRVTNFRSVFDSNWINCNNITSLVGINESGKSNILLALWKLKPARGGDIDPLHDLPVTKLSTLRDKLSEEFFIEAVFSISDSSKTFNETFYIDINEEEEISIKRYYDGHYSWNFFNENTQKAIEELQQIDDEENKKENDNVEEKFSPQEISNIILSEIPSFVYYSNYGNLASKIYLPHAIKWLKGEKIEGISKREDQIRTIRVLFEYVNLKPEEILELGKDAIDLAREKNKNIATPSEAEIKKAENDKEERALLLQSAGTKLTRDFRNWWKQGEYTFRFHADGDYFQIWVSDKKRPEEVDLELRSTGLQWFLSFYLIFLVESQNQNAGAILLLDEAGLTLHPLAQKDLSAFLNKLSENNQIINTTHSPFIIDTENIDRCRVVFSDEKEGGTIVSENLREGTGEIGKKSIYAVHAALGLSVSDVMFQGSQIVIVEGISDQYYLTGIKTILIRDKKIAPKKEIIFAPSGGVKGVPGITALISAKNEDLPFIVLDSDKNGEDFKKKLETGLYKDTKDHILSIADFTKMQQSEIEDIIPYSLLEKAIEKILGIQDEDDEFQYEEGKTIIPQIETFAREHDIKLENGWKVTLAKSFKKQSLNAKKKKELTDEYINKWTELFKKFS